MTNTADTTFDPGADDFQARLLDRGVLVAQTVPGLCGRGAAFEEVVAGLIGFTRRIAAADGAERLAFPPVMSRAHLERNGYFSAFPHLAGCVHCFMGGAEDHRRLVGKLVCEEDVADEFLPSEVVLVPAACYPVYPTLSARGMLPTAGALIEVTSYCFRHEPSSDLARQQSFRMQEFIRVGAPDDAMAFRDMWMQRAEGLCALLSLPGHLDVANDPFFGDTGGDLAGRQRHDALKFEMLLPAGPDGALRACMSFNAHRDHFGAIWDIRQHDGEVAHTACVGFGLERLTLALFCAHGPDIAAWPDAVRHHLGLDPAARQGAERPAAAVGGLETPKNDSEQDLELAHV